MSALFQPVTLNGLTLKNRFMQSATVEGMATERGEVTDALVKRCRAVARGGVGLIVPGALYMHASGRAVPHMTGIHEDVLVPGLRTLVGEPDRPWNTPVMGGQIPDAGSLQPRRGEAVAEGSAQDGSPPRRRHAKPPRDGKDRG